MRRTLRTSGWHSGASMKRIITICAAVLLLLALQANCATGRSSQADKQALQDEAGNLRAEVDELKRRLDALRRDTDARVEAAVPTGTALGFPGGDVSALRLEWSSVHAGH